MSPPIYLSEGRLVAETVKGFHGELNVHSGKIPVRVYVIVRLIVIGSDDDRL